MRKMRHISRYELFRDVPLLLCGIFMVYIAAFDGTLFQAIAVDMTNRLVVTFATIIAAALPMFFAIGAIKQSILFGRETIYYYEKLLKAWAFWLLGGILLVSVAALSYTQGALSSATGIVFIILCVISAIYLFYYTVTLARVRLRKRE
jgi:hypothetical protein